MSVPVRGGVYLLKGDDVRLLLSDHVSDAIQVLENFA